MTFKNFKAGGDNGNTSFKGTVCKISPLDVTKLELAVR